MDKLNKAAKRLGLVDVVERIFLPRSRKMVINSREVTYHHHQLFSYLHHRPDDTEFWFEEAVSKRFAELCEAGDVVFDIGSDHGFYSLLAATELGEDGHIVAFEAHPDCVAALQHNLLGNNLESQVSIEQVALSDREGQMTFDNNSLTPDADSGITVQSTTLDDFCQTRNISPDFIKIDVEGAETLVLAGAESTLRNSQPKLLLELHSEEKLNNFGHSQEEVYQLLQSNGYKLTRHEEEEEGNGKVVDSVPGQGFRHHLFALPE